MLLWSLVWERVRSTLFSVQRLVGSLYSVNTILPFLRPFFVQDALYCCVQVLLCFNFFQYRTSTITCNKKLDKYSRNILLWFLILERVRSTTLSTAQRSPGCLTFLQVSACLFYCPGFCTPWLSVVRLPFSSGKSTRQRAFLTRIRRSRLLHDQDDDCTDSTMLQRVDHELEEATGISVCMEGALTT